MNKCWRMLIYRLAVVFLAIGGPLAVLSYICILIPRLLPDVTDLCGKEINYGNAWLCYLLAVGLLHIGIYLAWSIDRLRYLTIEKVALYTAATFLFAIAMLMFVTGQRFASRSERENLTSCMSHQRTLALEMQMYAQENDERLPRNWAGITAMDDSKIPDLFVCPSTDRLFHKRGGYGYNGYIAGRKVDACTNPSQTILTADSRQPAMLLMSNADIDFNRHWKYGAESTINHGAIIAYLDGHVSFNTGTDIGYLNIPPIKASGARQSRRSAGSRMALPHVDRPG